VYHINAQFGLDLVWEDAGSSCLLEASLCWSGSTLSFLYNSGKYGYGGGLVLDKTMCEMTEFFQLTPGFHVPCLLWKQRHEQYVIMLCWLLKNERTYACTVHVKYLELITRFMQIKKHSYTINNT